MHVVTKRFLAAKSVVKNKEGRFLILREADSYEEGTNIGKWDVPGGRLEVEETLLDGLNREIKEETGLEVVVRKLVDARENFPVIHGEKVHIVRLYYLCSAENDSVILSKDHDKFEWITKDEVTEYPVMTDVLDIINAQ